MTQSKLPVILQKYHSEILNEWVGGQIAPAGVRAGLGEEAELREQCKEFLTLLTEAIQTENTADSTRPELTPVRELLERIARSRGEQGLTPTEIATFVFSLKNPLFARIREELEKTPDALFEEIWIATQLIDQLGLITTEVAQRSREVVIHRQQAEMLELSTPVVKLWEAILALPLIGTLDSARTQTVMETLLERVVETSSEVVIIDITGVPMVDTLIAQHLLKTVAAARLMGVDCIISGIRPQIAQTIVHLGVELATVTTKASLADAFKMALSRRGLGIVSRAGSAAA